MLMQFMASETVNTQQSEEVGRRMRVIFVLSVGVNARFRTLLHFPDKSGMSTRLPRKLAEPAEIQKQPSKSHHLPRNTDTSSFQMTYVQQEICCFANSVSKTQCIRYMQHNKTPCYTHSFHGKRYKKLNKTKWNSSVFGKNSRGYFNTTHFSFLISFFYFSSHSSSIFYYKYLK